MKNPDLIAVVLGVPAAVWYLFSADTPGEFMRHGLTIACLVALVLFVLSLGKPPTLIEQEFGPPEED